MHQENIVKKANSDFFVFYIDGILKQERNTHNIELPKIHGKASMPHFNKGY